jgi:hypothetical protein
MDNALSLRSADLHSLGDECDRGIETKPIIVAPVSHNEQAKSLAPRHRTALQNFSHDVDAHLPALRPTACEIAMKASCVDRPNRRRNSRVRGRGHVLRFAAYQAAASSIVAVDWWQSTVVPPTGRLGKRENSFLFSEGGLTTLGKLSA